MEEIERTELQRKEEEWQKQRREFRTQVDQLKSDLQQKQNELDREKRTAQDKQREVDRLVAERDMLQHNQVGFDSERVFLMGEIERYRHECDEMRGFVRGLELALSTLGRPVANPMID